MSILQKLETELKKIKDKLFSIDKDLQAAKKSMPKETTKKVAPKVTKTQPTPKATTKKCCTGSCKKTETKPKTAKTIAVKKKTTKSK